MFEPVTVFFGPPMPSATRASEVRQAMQELSVEAFRSHKDLQRPIHLGFVRRAKRRWRGVLAVDADGSRITFGSALTAAPATSGRIRLAMLKAACFVMPASMIVRAFVKGGVRDVDQVATILYSYPPESPETPRGAMLTHHNLLSNLESLRQVFHVTRDDCILGLV